MQKIETIFNRGEDFRIIPEVRVSCEWVFAGEGVPTEKLDGTNVRLTITDGKVTSVEKRRNPSKQEKLQGVQPGYADTSRSDPQDKYIFRAVDNTNMATWPDGKHECEAVGPKIQGNPLELSEPVCYPFTFIPVILEDMPRDFDSIREYVLKLDSKYSPNHPAEGIVFHHPDGRMAKIKAKDFRR